MRKNAMRIVYSIAIVVVLLMRLQLVFTRYFDPDEFAHLHWTWLIGNGYLPYRDFFFYILPGFQLFLAPVLWFAGDSTNFLIASRIFLLLTSGVCAWIVYRLSGDRRLPRSSFLRSR